MREDILEGLLKDGYFLALLHRNVEFFKALAGTQMMQVHYEKLEQELSRVQQRGTPVV